MFFRLFSNKAFFKKILKVKASSFNVQNKVNKRYF